MNCKVCNRKLKNHTETGMGKVCQKKNRNIGDDAAKSKLRVEPLFVRRQPRRTYLVFTSPRRQVVVTENEDGRFANCPCSATELCEHRIAVAEVDRAKFPQDIAETAAAETMMICLSDRQDEYNEAVSRAADSDLELFNDFEKDSYVVVNRATSKEYRVVFKTVSGKALVSCECKDFSQRNRICKHLAYFLQGNFCVLMSRIAAAEVA